MISVKKDGAVGGEDGLSTPPSASRDALLHRVDGWLAGAETVLAGGMVGAVAVIVLWQVAMRYLFERPLAWTEELSRYLFVWLSLLGAALAFKRGMHFLFDQLVVGLRDGLRSIVTVVSQTIVGVLLMGGLVFGMRLAYLVRVERSAALDLPMVWVYAALPVSVALMLFHMAARILDDGEREDSEWL